jgi:transposase InsO family protein
MRFAFIRDHRGVWPVGVMCRVLQVARSGFYAWGRRPPSPRRVRRDELACKARAVYEANRGVYGSPRVHEALLAQGERVCVNTVAKVMREQRIAAKNKPKFTPRTTDSTHGHPVAANVLGRDFQASAPNQKWVADITYIDTGEGWLYLAAVMDLFSRKIVGWSMADHLRTELVSDALTMALIRRCPTQNPCGGEGFRGPRGFRGFRGLLHHSDRGSQYASDGYRGLLAAHGLRCSMSAAGSCYDNAVMESFFGTLKTELVHHERYATRDRARASIFQYIEVFYNRQRLHSTLGYQSPEAFEAGLN